MDVYYMSDCVTYASFRNPIYRDYEKFPYGTLENSMNSTKANNQRNILQGKNENRTKPTKSSKESCPFCKEQKKRPLGAYMKKREQFVRSDSIMEDNEEEHTEHNHDKQQNNGK